MVVEKAGFEGFLVAFRPGIQTCCFLCCLKGMFHFKIKEKWT
jgi:hypothetical protein